ncbi:hypothetical protein ES703_81579 [subsurface metagenome]
MRNWNSMSLLIRRNEMNWYPRRISAWPAIIFVVLFILATVTMGISGCDKKGLEEPLPKTGSVVIVEMSDTSTVHINGDGRIGGFSTEEEEEVMRVLLPEEMRERYGDVIFSLGKNDTMTIQLRTASGDLWMPQDDYCTRGGYEWLVLELERR